MSMTVLAGVYASRKDCLCLFKRKTARHGSCSYRQAGAQVEWRPPWISSREEFYQVDHASQSYDHGCEARRGLSG
jgi:hypothetical protein